MAPGRDKVDPFREPEPAAPSDGSEFKPVAPRPWPPARERLPRPVSDAPRPAAKPTFQPRPQPVQAMGRRFVTQNEPAVKLGDGLLFSLAKPGTFTSLKSEAGDFLMAQRVGQTPDGRHYNTAVAFKLGADTLIFDTEGGTHAATLTLNGQAFTLGTTTLREGLSDGGSLKYDPGSNKIYLKTGQGDRLTVRRTTNPNQAHFLNVTVDVAESRPLGSVSGLLGYTSEDGLTQKAPRLRDGSTFSRGLGADRQTPEQFADAWRSTPDENLF
jgi:hypothetical protein